MAEANEPGSNRRYTNSAAIIGDLLLDNILGIVYTLCQFGSRLIALISYPPADAQEDKHVP